MSPPLSPLGNLERLAIVGTSGMGALTYRPVIPMEHAYDEMTLDEIARECERIPNLDYDLLMQLTRSMSECEKLFRLMCFNVFAHNRDDHSKKLYLHLQRRRGEMVSVACL